MNVKNYYFFSIGWGLKIQILTAITIIFVNYVYAQNNKNAAVAQKSEFIAKVGNIENRNVQKGEFKLQEGVIAFSKINVSHWEPIVVNSFLLIILRDTSVVFQYKNNGNKFENAIRSAFHNLQGNDSILIFSIRARLANGEIVFLNPLEFNIE